MSCNITCLGDPVVDILAVTDPGTLVSLGIVEGGSTAISQKEFNALVKQVTARQTPKRRGGGSAANVAKGLANLLPHDHDLPVSFAGRIGNDDAGRDYELELQAQHVKSLLCCADTEETAACFCMVTNNGQRTMRTCLAAASGLKSINQLPGDWIKDCQLLHLEGYVLYRPQLAREAVQSARAAGALVSLDLSSFELVEHCKEVLSELIEGSCIDIIACNEEEASALAKIFAAGKGLPEIQAAQAYLMPFCQVSVVSLGAGGCVIQGRGDEAIHCTAPPTHVKDTVGAGDSFTAGFLYAYMKQLALRTCGQIGCCVGSISVQYEGATLDEAAWTRARAEIKKIAAM